MSIRNALCSVLSVSLTASALTIPIEASARTPAIVASAAFSAASAFEEPAAVLGLDGEDETAAKNLTTELRKAFGRRGLGGSEDLSLAEVRLTMGCANDEPECLAEAGKSIGVENLIYGSLEPSGDGYKLTLTILKVQAGVPDTTTTRPVSREQLAPENIEPTANDIVESLFPADEGDPEVIPAGEPITDGSDPDEPYVEPRDQPSKSGLVWGAYKPRPKWKWAGFGVGVGLTVVGIAGAAYTGFMLSGPLRDEVFDAAEASLDDCLDPQDMRQVVVCEAEDDPRNLVNDVDPEMEGDLCEAGRSTTDATGAPITEAGAVRNAAVADACNRADGFKSANIASFVVLGAGAALTLVFTALLFVHKENATTRAMRRRDLRLGASPVPGGGVSFSGGFRF